MNIHKEMKSIIKSVYNEEGRSKKKRKLTRVKTYKKIQEQMYQFYKKKNKPEELDILEGRLLDLDYKLEYRNNLFTSMITGITGGIVVYVWTYPGLNTIPNEIMSNAVSRNIIFIILILLMMPVVYSGITLSRSFYFNRKLIHLRCERSVIVRVLRENYNYDFDTGIISNSSKP